MKIIKTEDIETTLPLQHYDLASKRLIDESDSRNLKVSLVRMSPAGRCDPHVHEDAGQFFFVLEGEMMVKADGVETSVKKGQAVLISSGEVHENYNINQGDTEYLVITCRSPQRS
jgi:quercetin dioxygenase-like cupin family protein